MPCASVAPNFTITNLSYAYLQCSVLPLNSTGYPSPELSPGVSSVTD